MRFQTLVFVALTILSVSAFAGPQEDLEAQYTRVRNDTLESKESLNASERKALLKATSENPIARLSQVSHYDPEGYVGFCFGRAMTAHFLARKMGLKEASIRKLFIIGDLRSGPDPEWRFHVTTLVKSSEDGGYYAIDPIMRPPVSPVVASIPAHQWIENVQNTWDSQRKARLFLVDSDTIVPDMKVFSKSEQDETGQRVIDLTFHPEDHAGFVTSDLGGKPIYTVDLQAQEDFFTRVLESQPNESFEFAGFDMTILDHGQVKQHRFDYHGYFADLLTNLETALAPVPVEEPGGFSALLGAIRGFTLDNQMTRAPLGFRVPE